MGETGDETGPNRITTDRDDRNRRCCFLRRLCGESTEGHDHIHLETYQLGRELGKAIALPFGKPILDDDGLAFRIAQFTQTLAKGLDPWRRPRIGPEETEPRRFPRLLRLSGDRRGFECQREKQHESGDELARCSAAAARPGTRAHPRAERSSWSARQTRSAVAGMSK